MLKELLVVVPSRGRPQNISRLVDAMGKTCRAATDLWVGLDDDDPQLPAYQEMDTGPYPWWSETRPDLRNVVPWVNHLAMARYQDYQAVGHIGDDNVPLTDGWDVEMLMGLEQTPFAFGNDLYPRAPGSLCCHVFMRSDVLGRLGYFGPPQIYHMYVDVAWMAWGTKCGITYRHDVIIDHQHFTTGRAETGFDASYQRTQHLIPVDLNNWHAYCQSGQLNADIEKIGGGTPFTDEELRTFNRDLNIPQFWGQPVVW
jgi:hypothetical protein